MLNMNMDEEDAQSVQQWETTPEAEAIRVHETALKKKVELIRKHSQTIGGSAGDRELAARRSFTHSFLASRIGMNPKLSVGKRSANLSKQFKQELQEQMGVENEEVPGWWWCPVRREFCEAMKVGHLFPSRSGHQSMITIFGPAELDRVIDKPKSGKSELFRAVNGIWWSVGAEDRFTRGMFVIVPDLREDATTAEIHAWQKSDPKEYKIKVIRPEAKEMKEPTRPDGDKLWNSINNQRLDFKGKTFRPRARYIYWTYLEGILGLAYSDKKAYTEVPQRELGRPYWGSAGSYIRENQLRGFVEEIGHQYDHLLEGAMAMAVGVGEGEGEGEGEESEKIAFAHANENLMEKLGVRTDDDEDDDDDDDEDDEEGEEDEED